MARLETCTVSEKPKDSVEDIRFPAVKVYVVKSASPARGSLYRIQHSSTAFRYQHTYHALSLFLRV